MKNIVVIDSHKITLKVLTEKLSGFEVRSFKSAAKAIEACDLKRPDLVILELGLEGHSGLEFLYEFRSYVDWMEIPVVIYSMVKLPEEVTNSPAFAELDISRVYYKPETDLTDLIEQCRALVDVNELSDM